MKSLFFIVVTVVVLWTVMIAFHVLQGQIDHLRRQLASASTSSGHNSASTPALPSAYTSLHSEPLPPVKLPPQDVENLSIIRGDVLDVRSEGILVMSTAAEIPAPQWRAPANAGAADTQRIAGMGKIMELQTYGKLRIKRDGRIEDCEFTPPVTVVGPVMLIGMPDLREVSSGQSVKIVAANTGLTYAWSNGAYHKLRVYTLDFDLSPKAASMWMWKPHGNPLER